MKPLSITSPRIASLAGRGFRAPSTLSASDVRLICASALAQTKKGKAVLAKTAAKAKAKPKRRAKRVKRTPAPQPQQQQQQAGAQEVQSQPGADNL